MIEYTNFLSSPYNEWQEIDVIVSRDCTLRCTYCYLQKNKDLFYDMDAVIESLDRLLKKAYDDDRPGVVLSLYPEPWVNIERTNELVKRSIEKLLKYDRFTSNFMIMIGTNGVNLHRPIPILKNLEDHLSLNVTIDGIKEQHDKYRVFPDGSPSWDIVVNNIKSYQKKYNIYGTKVTLGPDTIKYLHKSSVFLWDELGMQDINMNVAFENIWGDDYGVKKSLEEFENQISLLYDDIVRNRRWEKSQYQSILGRRQIPGSWIGVPERSSIVKTYCGAAMMRSIDSDGTAYPCFRLSPYATNEKKTYALSNKEVGRALKLLNNFDSSPKMCRECELLSNCAMCVGGVIEDSDSIYWRTTYHCEFQKIQSKWALKLYQKMNEE